MSIHHETHWFTYYDREYGSPVEVECICERGRDHNVLDVLDDATRRALQ